jgi:hypothetical protein
MNYPEKVEVNTLNVGTKARRKCKTCNATGIINTGKRGHFTYRKKKFDLFHYTAGPNEEIPCPYCKPSKYDK